MMAPSDLSSAEIRLIDLEKRFGAVRAVDGVSLDVPTTASTISRCDGLNASATCTLPPAVRRSDEYPL